MMRSSLNCIIEKASYNVAHGHGSHKQKKTRLTLIVWSQNESWSIKNSKKKYEEKDTKREDKTRQMAKPL